MYFLWKAKLLETIDLKVIAQTKEKFLSHITVQAGTGGNNGDGQMVKVDSFHVVTPGLWLPLALPFSVGYSWLLWAMSLSLIDGTMNLMAQT